MRKPFVAGLVFVTVTLATTAVFACGDKLMLLAGSARFRQVFPGSRPASILAYSRQNSSVHGLVNDLEHQSTLKHAGYKVFAIEDRTRLDEALKTGKFDLLLVDAADAEGLEPQARSAPSRPLVLPVVYKSTKAEAKSVERKFHCVLKAPSSPDRFLAAIDEAMGVKLKMAQ